MLGNGQGPWDHGPRHSGTRDTPGAAELGLGRSCRCGAMVPALWGGCPGSRCPCANARLSWDYGSAGAAGPVCATGEGPRAGGAACALLTVRGTHTILGFQRGVWGVRCSLLCCSCSYRWHISQTQLRTCLASSWGFVYEHFHSIASNARFFSCSAQNRALLKVSPIMPRVTVLLGRRK